ncbi:hypothetical protein ACLOJK_038041 [Asimina triloba]
MWPLGFWVFSATAFVALLLFLCGTPRYRHFRPGGNPLPRVLQVAFAALKKWKVEVPPNAEDLHGVDGKESTTTHGGRKIHHSQEFKFLDRAAVITAKDYTIQDQAVVYNPWRLCTVTQVEEVKCILRLLPIWLCTIIYSVVFTQMASLFVEQGTVIKTNISKFRIPPASMSSFDILNVALFIFFYRHFLNPLVRRLNKNSSGGLTELQRMGVGLYTLIGASEVFMYVGQLEFFNGQAPDGLKSFGSALCMTSISLGNYVSSLLVTIVMEITKKGGSPGKVIEAQDEQIIRWDKEDSKLFIRKLDRLSCKTSNIKFATCFSDVISNGLLWEEPDQIASLRELVMIGCLLDFDVEAVEFLLRTKNLQVFKEDEEFLKSALTARSQGEKGLG